MFSRFHNIIKALQVSWWTYYTRDSRDYNVLYHRTEQNQMYQQINKWFTFVMRVLCQENQGAEIESNGGADPTLYWVA